MKNESFPLPIGTRVKHKNDGDLIGIIIDHEYDVDKLPVYMISWTLRDNEIIQYRHLATTIISIEDVEKYKDNIKKLL